MLYNKKNIEELNEAGRQFPGSFKIRSANLINTKGRHDIIDIITRITVYEGMQQPFLFGKIELHDPYNTILHARIMGDETLEIQIEDGVLKTSLKFKCYKIGDRLRTAPQVERYSLYFMSFDAFHSQYRKVSKSYINMKGEDIIKDMFQIATGNKLSEKSFYYHPSLNDICCVIPNWELGRACSFVAARTIPPDEDLQANSYSFFQTLDGLYNFFPTEGLIDRTRNKPLCQLYFDPLRRKGEGEEQTQIETTKHDPSSRKRIISLEELEIVKGIDYLENINTGMFANKTSVIDLTQREIDTKDFNYIDDFKVVEEGGSKHLGPHEGKGPSFPLLEYNSEVATNPYNAWFPVFKSKGLFTEENDGHNWYNTSQYKKFSKNIQMENFVLKGVMPGHLSLFSGQIVSLVIPDGSRPEYRGKGKNDVDKYLSGEYLVKSVTRIFTLKKFEMHVELIKDSISQHPQFGLSDI